MDIIDRKLDVICQHTCSGEVIPIKLRMIDDDGEWQIYKIKAYKTLSCPGTIHLPNSVDTTLNTWIFECQLVILGRIIIIKLHYNIYDGIWKIVGL